VGFSDCLAGLEQNVIVTLEFLDIFFIQIYFITDLGSDFRRLAIAILI
jgi:hypothetical protein